LAVFFFFFFSYFFLTDSHLRNITLEMNSIGIPN
jgi:hypothetical protein